MKALLSGIMLLACFAVTQAQSKTSLEELQETYSQAATWENAGQLTFHEETQTLTVKTYRIPVTENTDARAEKNIVRFYLQNGTAVTDSTDTSWKRAAFEIPFRDKKSAAEFVKNFNNLKKGK